MPKTLTALLLSGLLGLSLPVLAETDPTGPTVPEPTPEEPSDISPTDPTDDGGYTPAPPPTTVWIPTAASASRCRKTTPAASLPTARHPAAPFPAPAMAARAAASRRA